MCVLKGVWECKFGSSRSKIRRWGIDAAIMQMADSAWAQQTKDKPSTANESEVRREEGLNLHTTSGLDVQLKSPVTTSGK